MKYKRKEKEIIKKEIIKERNYNTKEIIKKRKKKEMKLQK